MAEAAVRVLTDDDLHKRLARAARKRVVEEFDQDRVVGRYREIYERVVAASRPAEALDTVAE
jgi:glycosyltransferase involved in cell wall biosynthesis